MSANRREFLKMTGAGLGGLFMQPAASETISAGGSDDSMAMLYDATVCVGCKACQTACKRRSDLPPELDSSGLFDAPQDLSADTWTLIKLYQKDPLTYSFVKVQCMHCVDPACVGVCPVGALEKSDDGPVTYDENKCFGCRYCMAACPFGIPKYEWDKVLPLVQKCDFCADRQEEGLNPACGDACPTGALIYGKRSDLLEVAKARIKDNPGKYIDYVYGEHEVGGTSMLYISHIPFEELGFPTLDEKSLPDRAWPYMAAVPGIVVGVGGLMSAIYWVTKRRMEAGEED